MIVDKKIDINIKEGTKGIASYALFNCLSLASVTIPNSVTNISNGAFSGCSDLTSVTIPNSVTNIGDDAFSYCSSLKSITIPNSVTAIGEQAFNGCAKLTSITIPNSVTSIGNDAFLLCETLKKVVIEVNKDLNIKSHAFTTAGGLKKLIMKGKTLPKSTSDDFASGLYNTCTLYVPSSLYEKYCSTSPWRKFTNIKKYE